MTASPLAELPGLYVDLGQHTRPWSPERGAWFRVPAADYRCRCGYQASASGDAVPHFVATIRDGHKPNCTLTAREDAA